MDRVTQLKLAFALVAAVLFAASMRIEGAEFLRWTAIALLVAAVLLRFVRKRPPPE